MDAHHKHRFYCSATHRVSVRDSLVFEDAAVRVLTCMIDITNISQWENLLAGSESTPFIVFKHSKTCPESGDIMRGMEEENSPFDGEIYRVTAQTSQDVASQIAQDLGVEHETPQLIVVKNQKAVYAASHLDIDMQTAARCLE